jgi:predicted dehydrogenase
MALPTESFHLPDVSGGAAAAAGGSGPARPPSRRRAKQTAPASVESAGGPRDVILVGCETLAQSGYFPALDALQQAGLLNVRAIVEMNESAREWGRRKFPRVLILPSFEAVVAPPDALVIISTPVRFHAAQASAAFKRGWHVLCANPFAITAREAALMIATAERQERVLAVDLRQRFFPAARYLRTLCRDHLLGPPISFRIHEGTPRPAPDPGLPVAEKFESPEGVLNELGVPVLDLLTWCLGSASVKTYADDAMGGVEASAFIDLAFPEGVRGTIHLSRDWPTEQSYTLVFERGIVRWGANRPNRMTLQLSSAPCAIEGELVTPLSAGHSLAATGLLATAEEAIIAQFQNILGAIGGREPLRVPATETMHSLSIIEECYARRTQLPQPWLQPNEVVQARACASPKAHQRS